MRVDFDLIFGRCLSFSSTCLIICYFFNIYFLSGAPTQLASPNKGLVVNGWSFDVNSKIMTSDVANGLVNLNGKNVSDVVATDMAFAVRIALDNVEAESAVKRFMGRDNLDAHNHPIAYGDRAAAIWVVWGEFDEIGKNYDETKDWGGLVSQEAIEHLRDAATWPEEIARTGDSVGHVIYANDICPMKNAFVAILNGRMACWGSQTTCTGWKDIYGDRPSLKTVQVLCAIYGYAAVPILSNTHPVYKSTVSVFGKPGVGGDFPVADAEFMKKIAAIGDAVPISFVGNRYAVSLLLQGGTVLAWGDSEYGGSIPSEVDANFIRSIYANGIGFAALKATKKVVSWGKFKQNHIPKRILEGEGTARVDSILTSSECFLAMLEGGSVATWGLGDQNFCNEEGAEGSDTYIPFLEVKAQLQSGVKRAAVNKWAFVAIKGDNNDVVTWGHKAYGGSIKPPPDRTKNWKQEDIRRAKPETLVATCCAFGFIREDTRGVSWGNDYYAGWLVASSATRGLMSITASNETMAAIDRHQSVLRWNGKTNGVMDVNSKHTGYGLNYHPKFLFRTIAGIVAVMGEDCNYAEWHDWSECSKPCGGGTTTRIRHMNSTALNGSCDYKTTESKSCNETPCATERVKAKVSDIPTSIWVGIAGASLLFCGIGVYACVACCGKKQEQYIYM